MSPKTKSIAQQKKQKTYILGTVLERGRKKNLAVYTKNGWEYIPKASPRPATDKEIRAIQKGLAKSIYEKYKGQSLETADGHKIRFTMNGLKHVGYGPEYYSAEYRFHLILSLQKVDKIIEKAILLQEVPHKKGNPNCRVFIFHSTYTTDNGLDINVRITVKKNGKTGKTHYDHYFVRAIR